MCIWQHLVIKCLCSCKLCRNIPLNLTHKTTKSKKHRVVMTSREAFWTKMDLFIKLGNSRSPFKSSVEYQIRVSKKLRKSKVEFLVWILVSCCPRPIIFCVQMAENFIQHPEAQYKHRQEKLFLETCYLIKINQALNQLLEKKYTLP